jgi:hypothetical protein
MNLSAALVLFFLSLLPTWLQPTGIPLTIKFYEGFEKSVKVGEGWSSFEFGLTENMRIVTDKARAGNKSVRVNLRKTDPEALWGNKRTELTHNNYGTPARIDSSLRWWAFSHFFPANYAADPAEEIIAQWHDKSPYCSASPMLAIEIIEDRFRAMIRYSTADYCSDKNSVVVKTFDLGPVIRDQWIDWVIHYNPQANGSGYVSIWQNGINLLTYTGPCRYIGSYFPYFKIGLYKWSWMPDWTGVQSILTERSFYFDEVKIADNNASLADFKITEPGK